MKLKYYLRGLGIGMLVTALVLILSGNTGEKMSDEAVKRRAAQLGMVEKDKTVLEDIGSGEDAQPETSEEEPGSGEIEENAEEQPGETASEADTERLAEEVQENVAKQPEGQESPENMTEQTGESEPLESAAEQTGEPEADTEEQTPAQEIEQRADEVADRAQEVAENSVLGKTVTLEIRSGDSSVSVARKAAEAGLVQSAADFDVFLCQNGYDKRISIGNYEITVGTSEKEIADVITKSK